MNRSIAVILLVTQSCLAQTQIPNRAKANSAEPNLVRGADGKMYLSWIESARRPKAALRFAVWEGSEWSSPITVATGDNWFVNWADFPSLAVLKDGTIAAHWLQKSGAGAYSYDVKISVSRDGGKTWSEPKSPHRDGTQTEHGFVSMVPMDESTFGVLWLDGRAMTDDGGDMGLRYTTLSRDGRFGEELLIDDRVCECCQTSAAFLGDGRFLLTYRDRSKNETRDIRAAVVRTGKLQRSFGVNNDGWVIEGCPVNGPATATSGKTAVVVWPTSADDTSKVRARFSTDSGETWKAPFRVDDGDSIGRVDVVLLDANRAAVSWVKGGGAAEVRWRIVYADGRKLETQRVAKTLKSRASGFPRLARLGGQLFFAWTDATKPSQVRTAQTQITGR